MRDLSMRDDKKEFNGSRYFLWTCSGMLRDNVDHYPSKNVETTSFSASQSEVVKRRGWKNDQSLIVTVLCLPVAGHRTPYPDYCY